MPRFKMIRFVAFTAPLLVFAPLAAAQQSDVRANTGANVSPFTAAQASAGRDAYQQRCASCHLPDLRGSNEAPPLAGANFVNAWQNRTTGDLYNKIHDTMPANNPGTLSEQEAVNLVAFILQSNGVEPGARALTSADLFTIGDLPAKRGAAATPPPAQADAGAAPRAARRTGIPAGVTVEGDVKNYVPVTDDMLLHSNSADWLMIRGNYQAWNHSSLKQITPQNVGNLRLAWVWSMYEGNANEPSPLVHDGIIYIPNPDNVVQALDGRTGDLIWETRAPLRATGRRHRRHAQPGHLSGQSFHGHHRRAPCCARRAHRQNRLGHRHRRQ